MALSAAAKVGLLVAGTLAAGGVALAATPAQAKSKKKKGKKKSKTAPLSGVYAPGATIGAATVMIEDAQGTPEEVEVIVEDVQLPVHLVNISNLRIRMPDTGEIVEANIMDVETPEHLSTIVTDLTGDTAIAAYELFLHLVANQERDLSTPEAMDTAVREVLAVTAPKVDWTKGLQPYTAGSPEFDVWVGHQLVGEIAYQSYWNKQAGQDPVVPQEPVAASGTVDGVQWRVLSIEAGVFDYQIFVFPVQGFAGQWETAGTAFSLPDAANLAQAAAAEKAAAIAAEA